MIDWQKINTVLLDMDGTLLDLNFDNHFWQEFVPLKFAEQNNIDPESAKRQLMPRFRSMEGKLEWYCLDYWSETLQLDIAGLKAELSGLISVLPHVIDFLEKLKASPKKVLLVTNAHRNSLNIKIEKTCIHAFFDDIISSHDFGHPKESPAFWPCLAALHPFEKASTLLVDDSPNVLNSARQFGIAHLVSVSKPDTRMPKKTIAEYRSIEDFRELMHGL